MPNTLFSPLRIALIGAAAFLAPAAGQAASLLGDTISLNRIIPSISFDHCASNVGGSPCTTSVVAGLSDVVSLSGGNNLSINPEADSIVFIFGPDGGDGGEILDREIVISDLSFGSGITGITFSTDFPGFSPGMLSFTSSSVSFFPFGLPSYSGGQTLVVNLLTSSVPVPAAAPLLAGALIVMGLAGRRRKRKAT
jgi:hypothetical protein